MPILCAILLAASSAVTPQRPAPTPAATVSLTAAQRTQAQKTLAAAVAARQGAKWKTSGSGKGGKVADYQAHRCAAIYDERVTGKERTANGPFRTTCSDWVRRASRDLAQKDADQPCTAMQFGSSLVGCTTWIEQWDAGRAKWSEISRKSSP